MKLAPNEYISERLVDDYYNVFKECVETARQANHPNHVNILNIGYGAGSAITYLHKLDFQKVDYISIDVSIKITMMRSGGIGK